MSNFIEQDWQNLLIDRFDDSSSRAEHTNTIGWLDEIRREAIADFKKRGLPGRKNEEYKYFNIVKALQRKFKLDELNPSALPSKVSAVDVDFPPIDAYRLVTINGQLAPEYSEVPDNTDEFQILPLLEAIKLGHTELMHYLKDQSKTTGAIDPFALLNTAFSNDGVFIQVGENTILKKPILLLHVTEGESAAPLFYQSRSIVLGGKNAEFDIIEVQSKTDGTTTFVNNATGILADNNARITHYKIQNEHGDTLRVDNTFVSQKRDSLFNSFVCSLDGQMIRNNLNISLEDENCESHMYGLYITKGKTHIDNHTAVDHKQPHCFSNENYKGILDDQSSGVFNGKIYVRPHAQKTNAFQSNKNILLSNEANINTKPQLEIWADDVKCSHGCTTGRIDDEQLFYLRSRGLSLAKARVLLLHAFATDVLSKIDIEPLRAYLDDIVSSRLH